MDAILALATGGGLVALSGLGGVFLGRALENHSEHKRWLRDTRIKRYDAFLQAALAVVYKDRFKESAYKEIPEMMLAFNALVIIGPQRVHVAAQKVVDGVGESVRGNLQGDGFEKLADEFSAVCKEVLRISDTR